MKDKYPYMVYLRDKPILKATEQCRYPKQTELSILNAGYTIKLNGKRITKKELKG